jgi:lysozyme
LGERYFIQAYSSIARLDEFTDYLIWISDFYRMPNFDRDKRSWLFWQYSERGRMAGINTLVDLNVFYGTKEQFRQLLQRSE